MQSNLEGLEFWKHAGTVDNEPKPSVKVASTEHKSYKRYN